MSRLVQLAYHIGSPGGGPGDPVRLFERYPHVQDGAFAVASHYYWYLGRVSFGGAAKLILEVRENVSRLDLSNYSRLLDVHTLLIPLDLEQASQLRGHELKKLLLESVHGSVRWLAEQLEVATAPFDAAYEKVLGDQLQFGFYHKKGKSWTANGSKKKCKVYFAFDWDRYDVYADVYEGRTLLGHVHLHSTVPAESPFPSLVRDIKWTPGGKISLQTIDFSTAKRMTVTKAVTKPAEGPASEAAWQSS